MLALIGKTSSGLVPHVTEGIISSPFNVIVLSYFASESDFKVAQCSIALSHCSPFGAMGFPFKNSNVFSSGSIIPTLEPASIAILQTVILSSMVRLFITSPENSRAYPPPPAVPKIPMTVKIISLAVTPVDSFPLTSIFIFLSLLCNSV